jgi:hypothetical protein
MIYEKFGPAGSSDSVNFRSLRSLPTDVALPLAEMLKSWLHKLKRVAENKNTR